MGLSQEKVRVCQYIHFLHSVLIHAIFNPKLLFQCFFSFSDCEAKTSFRKLWFYISLINTTKPPSNTSNAEGVLGPSSDNLGEAWNEREHQQGAANTGSWKSHHPLASALLVFESLGRLGRTWIKYQLAKRGATRSYLRWCLGKEMEAFSLDVNWTQRKSLQTVGFGTLMKSWVLCPP